MKKPTLEEIEKLVTFERREDGSLRVKSVRGDVRGDAMGSVVGNVEGSIWGDVRGNVEGSVEGNIWGRKKEAAS